MSMFANIETILNGSQKLGINENFAIIDAVHNFIIKKVKDFSNHLTVTPPGHLCSITDAPISNHQQELFI